LAGVQTGTVPDPCPYHFIVADASRTTLPPPSTWWFLLVPALENPLKPKDHVTFALAFCVLRSPGCTVLARLRKGDSETEKKLLVVIIS
jgi:hypothetical protein